MFQHPLTFGVLVDSAEPDQAFPIFMQMCKKQAVGGVINLISGLDDPRPSSQD
jgi:hypothetical protein